VTHVVIETTSHGLDQYRTFGLKYKVGLITNLSPEHLDYHQTMEKYLAAKARIIRSSKHTFINLDSQPLQQLLSAHHSLLTFSQSQSADLTATNLKSTDQSTAFDLHFSQHFSQLSRRNSIK